MNTRFGRTLSVFALMFALPGAWPLASSYRGGGQEAEIGREADKEVQKEFGFYEGSPELSRYVTKVGGKVAAQTSRKDLPWTFRILDTPVVNALALPGGYVYVTRGILARLSSEDELAAVIGHEVAHVDQKHGTKRMTTQTVAEVLYGVFSMYDPSLAKRYQGLVQTSLGLAFLGYSREQEREADELGIRFMAKAGYNPRGAVKLMRTFETIEEREPNTLERFLMSHPPTKERLVTAIEATGDLGKGDRFTREPYLRAVDGLPLGQSRGGRVISGDAYADRELGLLLRVPDGFEPNLAPPLGVARFVRQTRDGNAVTSSVLSVESYPVAGSGGVEAFAAQYAQTLGARSSKAGEAGLATADGHPLVARIFDTPGKAGTRRSIAVFAERGRDVLVLRGTLPAGSFKSGVKPILASIASIRFPPAADLASYAAPGLRIEAVRSGETWASLSSRAYGRDDLASALAAYNAVYDASRQPEAGDLVKVPTSTELPRRSSDGSARSGGAR